MYESKLALRWIKIDRDQTKKSSKNRKYTAKVGQDNVNIDVVGQIQPSSGFNIALLNLKKAGVDQPKYCNNAYVHVVLTNLCSILTIL